MRYRHIVLFIAFAPGIIACTEHSPWLCGLTVGFMLILTGKCASTGKAQNVFTYGSIASRKKPALLRYSALNKVRIVHIYVCWWWWNWSEASVICNRNFYARSTFGRRKAVHACWILSMTRSKNLKSRKCAATGGHEAMLATKPFISARVSLMLLGVSQAFPTLREHSLRESRTELTACISAQVPSRAYFHMLCSLTALTSLLLCTKPERNKHLSQVSTAHSV